MAVAGRDVRAVAVAVADDDGEAALRPRDLRAERGQTRPDNAAAVDNGLLHAIQCRRQMLQLIVKEVTRANALQHRSRIPLFTHQNGSLLASQLSLPSRDKVMQQTPT